MRSEITLKASLNETKLNKFYCDTIYQPLRSGKIWHKVNF